MAKASTPKQKLTNAQRAYLSRIKKLVSSSSSFQSLLLQVRQQGKNYVRQTERLENKQFDSKFVDELEKGFDAIDHVITNPRTFIKDEPEVVEAGLAKKINAQSITHLASHTQFVHSVDKKGNVTPERILTIHAEIDVQIYENRFVMTLIKKCALFIEKRFNFIKDHGETLDSDLLLIKSTSNIDGAKYEIDSRIKVSSPSKDDGNKEKNEDILRRLAILRERCAYFLHSPFMADMVGAKDVSNPIHMTNMIVKNPYYHGAYELWKFIDQYTDLGVSYSVKETEQNFSQPYFEEILALVMADILTLRSNLVRNKKIDTSKTKDKIINPKVLFTLEDETYYDGKFLYDQFPQAKRKRSNPLALTPEEAKEERLAIEENLREERYKKTLVDENIEEQKNKDIAKEAIERQKKLEAEEKARLKAEKEAEKALAKQKILEEKKRKAEEKKALLQEQKELEKARRVIRRKAREDRNEKNKSVENEDINLQEVLSIQEEKPIIETPIEEQIIESPIDNLTIETNIEEPIVEEIRVNEPIVEETSIEEKPTENETTTIEETPVAKEETKDESQNVEILPKEETNIDKEPINDTNIEDLASRNAEEETTEEPEPETSSISNSKTISEQNIEETPAKPLPNEEKQKKKTSSRKKKEQTSKKDEENKEKISKPRKPRKKKEPADVIETKSLVEESAPKLDEPKVEEEPTNKGDTSPSAQKENTSKDKYVRDVPTFRAEKNYVFIKTRKSDKAKKVVLKGKLKI